jgi:hypothetical protein
MIYQNKRESVYYRKVCLKNEALSKPSLFVLPSGQMVSRQRCGQALFLCFLLCTTLFSFARIVLSPPRFSNGPPLSVNRRLLKHVLINGKTENVIVLRLYSKSSLTLKEWRFNLSFPWVPMPFLNSWRVSSHIVRYDTNPLAIQKQQWHSREAQIGTSTHWVWVWVSFWNTQDIAHRHSTWFGYVLIICPIFNFLHVI